MKKALLILGDGEVVELTGRWVLITETAGPKPELSIVDTFRDGLRRNGGIIFDTCVQALDYIREHRRRL